MIARGAPNTIGMLIDTSRNGWGGAGRPTTISAVSDADRFVDDSRIDRRLHDENRCNQAGGLGFKPWADPYQGIDAFVWVKPPGVSDGLGGEEGENPEYNPHCDPSFINPVSGQASGALAGSPPAGEWFPYPASDQ